MTCLICGNNNHAVLLMLILHKNEEGPLCGCMYQGNETSLMAKMSQAASMQQACNKQAAGKQQAAILS